MPITAGKWPQAVLDFAAFLGRQGLAFDCEIIYDGFDNKELTYTSDRIAVKVSCDRSCWAVDVSDLFDKSGEWYYDYIVLDFILGKRISTYTPFLEKLRLIEEHWSTLGASFAATTRESTHARLVVLQTDYARRETAKMLDPKRLKLMASTKVRQDIPHISDRRDVSERRGWYRRTFNWIAVNIFRRGRLR